MFRTTDPRAELEVVPASSLTASAPPCSGHEGHEASEQRGRLRPLGPTATLRYAKDSGEEDASVPPQTYHGTSAGRGEVAAGEHGSHGGSEQSNLQALLARQPAEHSIGSSRSTVPGLNIGKYLVKVNNLEKAEMEVEEHQPYKILLIPYEFYERSFSLVF